MPYSSAIRAQEFSLKRNVGSLIIQVIYMYYFDTSDQRKPQDYVHVLL